MFSRITRWIVNKLNKLEAVIRDQSELGRRPLLHDLFFKNSPRSVEYGWALSKIGLLPQRILDIGCKGTMFPILLANLGHKVTGIDMESYDEKHPNFMFIQGDILERDAKEKLAGHEFDVITLISTLEHIGISGRAPEDLNFDADVQLLRHLGLELLGQNGAIFVTVPYGSPAVMSNQKIYGDVELDDLAEKSYLITKTRDFYTRAANNWVPGKPSPIKRDSSVVRKGIRAVACLELKLERNK